MAVDAHPGDVWLHPNQTGSGVRVIVCGSKKSVRTMSTAHSSEAVRQYYFILLQLTEYRRFSPIGCGANERGPSRDC